MNRKVLQKLGTQKKETKTKKRAKCEMDSMKVSEQERDDWILIKIQFDWLIRKWVKEYKRIGQFNEYHKCEAWMNFSYTFPVFFSSSSSFFFVVNRRTLQL